MDAAESYRIAGRAIALVVCGAHLERVSAAGVEFSGRLQRKHQLILKFVGDFAAHEYRWLQGTVGPMPSGNESKIELMSHEICWRNWARIAAVAERIATGETFESPEAHSLITQ